MLKALELCGFKSFADKTRFEFPAGITVVVGPNGSGKSNIVDAIKWVLGEQSAKSLRGREMADVIFKGSGGAGVARRPANTAEATIVFENKDRLLPIDADEIRVTRRVFRSGEGEYLISGNPCRLRDVKDLFRGTGVGTDAYSLIEQGKVDTLLQASPRERRAIFEEAAGISRFKAKKVETQRRLERVEQNLTRLADIVDEVASRLRSVRNQASKARRYKEYTDRLKQLRTHVGWADWREFSERLADLQEQIDSVGRQLETNQQDLAEAEAQQQQIDQYSERLATELHEVEAQIGDFRQQLTGHEATSEHERERVADLEHEIRRSRRQYMSMTARAGDLGAQLDVIQRDLQHAEQTYAEIRGRLDESQAQRKATVDQVGQLRLGRDQQREKHARLLRESADLGRQLSVLEAEIQTATESLQRGQAKQQTLEGQRRVASSAKDDHERTEASLEQNERDGREALNKARRQLHTREHQLSLRQQELVELQRRHAVANERASVLQDLQKRHEGLGLGVKDVLSRAQDGEIGPLAHVCGLVADLIHVEVGMAPLIDVALGELTQYVVVDGPALGAEIASGNVALKGRVGLLDLTKPFQDELGAPNLNGERSVIGRADSFVDVDDRYKALVRHLLSSTWCVETLSDALRLREKYDGRFRFVSRTGDLVEDDGRMLAGPRQSGSGLVSRRSELRSLQHELVQLNAQIDDAEATVAQLKDEINTAELDVERESARYDQIASELAEARMQSHAARDRVAALDDQLASLQDEIDSAQVKRNAAETQHKVKSAEMERVSAAITEVESISTQQQQEMAELEVLSEHQAADVTAIRVELAKSEQRLDDLRGQRLRYEEDQRERTRALQELQNQLQQAGHRHQQATQLILDSTSAIAELYLAIEACQQQIERLTAERHQVNTQRAELHPRTQQLRQSHQQLDELRHRAELEASQARLERESLAQRVRDDYDIELSQVPQENQLETEDETREREEIDAEIAALRRKISNIGAVNMAALEEIESLEVRHESLATQFQDLTDAKNSLARIIHKINTDSRRLFTESLEAIRTNFQALFRRVFGGGDADIVLEEDVDILEAGIDIVATPPGKHSLGISLLSGGERALTAVTLLLAIFQYRPSPFCVLDEVDGPLDEANIGRFIDVLNGFLQWTKFVVVTHSKKTMTAATTLYGVTMQESGVSKQVSVQFEDVSDDGHISDDAVQRSAGPDDLPPSGPDNDESGGDERGAA